MTDTELIGQSFAIAWSDEFGCQCGAGMPCQCVRADGLEEPDVSGMLRETPPIKH